MSITPLLNEVAPKVTFWNNYFLKADTLPNDLTEATEKVNLLVDIALDNPNAYLDKVYTRLKQRQYQLLQFSESFWADTIFFRIFSPYTVDEILKRRQLLIGAIQQINYTADQWGPDSPLSEDPENSPLEYACSEYFVDSLEKVETQASLIKTPHGIFAAWSDEYTDQLRTRPVSDLATFNNITAAINLYQEFHAKTDPAKGQIVALVDSFENLEDLTSVSPRPTYINITDKLKVNKNRLFINYEGQYCYFGLGGDFVIGSFLSYSAMTMEKTLSIYENVNGYKTVRETLIKNFNTFLVHELPKEGEKPNDAMDIRIYIDDHRQGNFSFLVPENEKFKHFLFFYERLELLELRILEHYIDVLESLGVKIASETLPLNTQIREEYDPKPTCKLSNTFPIALRKHQLHSTGHEILSYEIPCAKTSLADLTEMTAIKEITPEKIELWKIRSSEFKTQVQSAGFLYSKEMGSTTKCVVDFEDNICPVPFISLIWKDSLNGIQTTRLKKMGPKALTYVRSLEARLTTDCRINIKQLNALKFEYFVSCCVVLGGTHLEVTCAGFLKDPEYYVKHTLPIEENDSYQTIEAKLEQQLKIHQDILQKTLDEIAPETGIPVTLNSGSFESIQVNEAGELLYLHHCILSSNYSHFVENVARLKHSVAINNLLGLLGFYVLSEDEAKVYLRSTFINKIHNTKKRVLIHQNPTTLLYRTYFLNPLYPEMLIQWDINKLEDLSEIDTAIEEVLQLRVSLDNFFERLSTFVPTTIPPKRNVDISVIKNYYSTANFYDKSAPNYVSPFRGEIDISETSTTNKLIKFYREIQLPQNAHILKILSNIVFEIEKMPLLKDRLSNAMETVAAMCYCSIKHESVFTSLYSLITGNIALSNSEMYDYVERELAYGDALKKGAVIEMAAEVLDPFNTQATISENNQSVHTEKRLITLLSNNGIKIPFAEMNTTVDDLFAFIGNYHTEDDVFAGFHNKLNPFHIINFYHQRHNTAFRENDLHAINAMNELLLSYVEQHIIPNNEKYTDHSKRLLEVNTKKSYALQKIRQTRFAHREQLCRTLRSKAIQSAQTNLEKSLVNTSWTVDEVLEAITAKKKWAMQGLKEKHKDSVNQETQPCIDALLLRAVDEEEKIRLENFIDTYIRSIKPLTHYWKSIKKERINAIEDQAILERNSILKEVLSEQNFVVYDEYSIPTGYTREGSKAILFAMNFLELAP
ncbi:MAG: hypothetical protein WC222_02440 [Parachlamydiales bacterium]|jgi:hypothetical protein